MIEIDRSPCDPMLRALILHIRPIYKLANSQLTTPADWREMHNGWYWFELYPQGYILRYIFRLKLDLTDGVVRYVDFPSSTSVELQLSDPRLLDRLSDLVHQTMVGELW